MKTITSLDKIQANQIQKVKTALNTTETKSEEKRQTISSSSSSS